MLIPHRSAAHFRYACTTTLYRFTGAVYNPSITLALLCAGSIKPLRFVCEFQRHSESLLEFADIAVMSTAQMLGGIAANAILLALTTGEMQVDLTLGSGISKTQGLFIEMFTTAVLAMNVLMLAAGASKSSPCGGQADGQRNIYSPLTPHWDSPSPCLPSCSTLLHTQEPASSESFLSLLSTLADFSPARAFGTSCIAGFQTYHWIYCECMTLGLRTRAHDKGLDPHLALC